MMGEASAHTRGRANKISLGRHSLVGNIKGGAEIEIRLNLSCTQGKYLMSEYHKKFGCGLHSSFFVIHVESALCAWGLSSGTWELTVKLVSTYSAHLLMESEHA